LLTSSAAHSLTRFLQLKNFIDFHDKAQAAINGNSDLTWAKIREHTADAMHGLSQQKVRPRREAACA
jgi:hypothetical protein